MEGLCVGRNGFVDGGGRRRGRPTVGLLKKRLASMLAIRKSENKERG